jgi:hypothetical protein
VGYIFYSGISCTGSCNISTIETLSPSCHSYSQLA